MSKKINIYFYDIPGDDVVVLSCDDLNEKLADNEIDADKIISITQTPNFRKLMISYKY